MDFVELHSGGSGPRGFGVPWAPEYQSSSATGMTMTWQCGNGLLKPLYKSILETTQKHSKHTHSTTAIHIYARNYRTQPRGAELQRISCYNESIEQYSVITLGPL